MNTNHHGHPNGPQQDEERQTPVDEEAQLLHMQHFDYEEEDDASFPQTIWRLRTSQIFPRNAPPRIQIIKPFLPSAQRCPFILLERLLPNNRHRLISVIIFLLLWAVTFTFILWTETRMLKDGSGRSLVNLDCVDTLWRRKNLCGLDGLDCRPFSNTTLAFRCPASCDLVQVLNPHAVGTLDVNYRALVVGNETYRGDSFICASAVHAGIVSAGKGGCGRLSRMGRQDSFSSSKRNGIESIAFDSYFPLSYTLSTDESVSCSGDHSQLMLYISLFFTIIFSFVTSSPCLQFFVTFTVIFAHVILVSDPPGASFHNVSVLPDHISRFAERFLPAAFCSVILYRTCVSRALQGLQAPVEKIIFWLGGFWLGALSNHTLAWIPIQRLTVHDLEQQPGAKVALAVIILVLSLIVAQQIYTLWLEQRLIPYLRLYGLFLSGILICLIIPGVNFRLHHYVIALLLLPGTSIQTRSSLLYQGILLGLFVNGVARWGFDSILQTPSALRGDASFDSLLPLIDPPLVLSTSRGLNISFSWTTPSAVDVTGISILVNDVERYRQFFAEAPFENTFTWTRTADLELSEYFRFAYLGDGIALDYTKAGTWFANGSWNMPM